MKRFHASAVLLISAFMIFAFVSAANAQPPQKECSFCHEQFSSDLEELVHCYLTHFETYHPSEAYCLICGMEFSTLSEVANHISTTHAGAVPSGEPYCPFCGTLIDPTQYEPFPPAPPPIGVHWATVHDWWPTGYAPPENWWPGEMRPPLDWTPPETWEVPENLLGDVIPPYMPQKSWTRPENWTPRSDWVPSESWKEAGFLSPLVCPYCGERFDSITSTDAHLASAHPDIVLENQFLVCPFCVFETSSSEILKNHVWVAHDGERLEREGKITLDQISGGRFLVHSFLPPELLKPPEGWENFEFPPMEKIPYFVPPWLDPKENHWVPPENIPFWTWERDNIAPRAQINIYITENTLPQINQGGGTWVTAEEVVENVLVGGAWINTSPGLEAPLNNVITTVLNLDDLPEGAPPPDENFYELVQIGTNIPEYIENAEVGFKVDQDWIAANNLDDNSITIEHYADGVWTELPTTITGEDENYLYCSAETPSFSVFAVTGTGEAIVPVPEEAAPEAFPWYLVGVGVGVAIVLMALALYGKRKL